MENCRLSKIMLCPIRFPYIAIATACYTFVLRGDARRNWIHDLRSQFYHFSTMMKIPSTHLLSRLSYGLTLGRPSDLNSDSSNHTRHQSLDAEIFTTEFVEKLLTHHERLNRAYESSPLRLLVDSPVARTTQTILLPPNRHHHEAHFPTRLPRRHYNPRHRRTNYIHDNHSQQSYRHSSASFHHYCRNNNDIYSYHTIHPTIHT